MLILASQSKSRKSILQSAGLCFTTVFADIDEQSVKQKDDLTAQDIALELAVKKAKTVSEKYPDAYVIGADQILELDGKLFSKPSDMNQARKQLKKMRGKTHMLINGLAVVKNGDVLWSLNAGVKVTMRDYSDNFLESYLQKIGQKACDSVGAYYIEELGSQLIEKIDGDYFSVLGLPLLPLLSFLRSQGEIEK